MIIRVLKICIGSLILIQSLTVSRAIGGSRFVETAPCSDTVKTYVGGRGTRIVAGVKVMHLEWSYIKTCNYQGKNDCRLYEHCYFDKVTGNIGIRRAFEEIVEKGELSMSAAKILEGAKSK